MQLTNLIGKQILSPAGEMIGYVLSAYPSRDMKKISCFLCADEEEEEFYLPAKSVLSYGDALIATRSHLSAPTGIPCPISNAVYSHTGQRMGVVGELLIGDDADALFIVHNDGAKITLPLTRVSVGDAIIVYPAGYKKPAAVRKPAKKPEAKQAQPAAVSPAAPQEPAAKQELPAETESAQEFDPGDALNRVNLLGRRLKKSVYDENGYPIALEGELITKNIVSLARRSNRLLQLAVNTLTNVI